MKKRPTNIKFARLCFFVMVSQEGFEPPTPGLEGLCSIQLSYWPISNEHYYNTTKKFKSQPILERIFYFFRWFMLTIQVISIVHSIFNIFIEEHHVLLCLFCYSYFLGFFTSVLICTLFYFSWFWFSNIRGHRLQI